MCIGHGMVPGGPSRTHRSKTLLECLLRLGNESEQVEDAVVADEVARGHRARLADSSRHVEFYVVLATVERDRAEAEQFGVN